MTDHRCIKVNHRHLDVARLTFRDDDRHPVAGKCVLDRVSGILCGTLNLILTSGRFGYFRQRGLHAGIGRLVSSRSIATIVDDQQNEIVVMKGGVVQQIGTPAEIYTRPANLFVADFMGSPALNLIPAKVEMNARGANSSSAGPRAPPLFSVMKR